MKASTLRVLKIEARLRGNQARLRLLTAQVAREDKARELLALRALVKARRDALERIRQSPRPRQAGDVQRQERWQIALRESLAELAKRQARAQHALAICEGAVDEQRREVTTALRRKQATESLERTAREQEIRQRERRSQGLLDGIASWRAARLAARVDTLD